MREDKIMEQSLRSRLERLLRRLANKLSAKNKPTEASGHPRSDKSGLKARVKPLKKPALAKAKAVQQSGSDLQSVPAPQDYVGWRSTGIPARRRQRTAPPTVPTSFRVPDPMRGKVVFSSVGPSGFSGPGKVRPSTFFPTFIYTLFKSGISCRFVKYKSEMYSELMEANSCLVMIYSETLMDVDDLDIRSHVGGDRIVFNSPSTGRLISRKTILNQTLSANGIPTPQRLTGCTADRPVFSNENNNSGATAHLLSADSVLDPERYNTEFIDTRREFAGRSYYTSIRVIAVGREMIHAYVRARPDEEDSPTVHAKNTPLDPVLVEHLQATMVQNREEELTRVTAQISDTLGPGFFVHDIVVCNRTEKIFVCESGFKFNDDAYTDHLFPISTELRSHELLFSGAFGKRAAEAFISEGARHGVFNVA